MYVNDFAVSLNVGADAELRDANGKSVLSFSGANTPPFGQRESRVTTWYRVSLWGRQAEVLADKIKKGNQVLVVGGSISNKPYTNKNGESKLDLTVDTNNVQLLDRAEASNDTSDDGGLF